MVLKYFLLEAARLAVGRIAPITTGMNKNAVASWKEYQVLGVLSLGSTPRYVSKCKTRPRANPMIAGAARMVRTVLGTFITRAIGPMRCIRAPAKRQLLRKSACPRTY